MWKMLWQDEGEHTDGVDSGVRIWHVEDVVARRGRAYRWSWLRSKVARCSESHIKSGLKIEPYGFFKELILFIKSFRYAFLTHWFLRIYFFTPVYDSLYIIPEAPIKFVKVKEASTKSSSCVRPHPFVGPNLEHGPRIDTQAPVSRRRPRDCEWYNSGVARCASNEA